MDREELSRVC